MSFFAVKKQAVAPSNCNINLYYLGLVAKSGSESSLSEDGDKSLERVEIEDGEGTEDEQKKSKKKEPDMQEEEKEKCSDDEANLAITSGEAVNEKSCEIVVLTVEEPAKMMNEEDIPVPVVRRRRSSARNNPQVNSM